LRLVQAARPGAFALALGLGLSVSVLAGAGAMPLRGSVRSHDPSTVIKCKDRYYLFSSGQGMVSKWSTNRVFWTAGPPVFANAPVWTTNAVPGFTGYFWAPDILYLNGRYCGYYAISTWGSQVSAIGLVTNPTLDPADPAYHWTDQGLVIRSRVGDPFNAIDPSVTLDAAGRPWMAFGSYWHGIYVVQLDPLTGKRVAPDSPTYHVAYNNALEASCLFRHGAYYYLFVNWGSCCAGVNSTYHIRMGRSPNITGPFLDREGADLADNGGTLFLESTGKFTGPGHPAVFSENGTDWFSYHYYDANAWAPWYGAYGVACFDLQPLSWTADGWPAFTNDWSAVYRFRADARDESGQYDGLLRGGASCVADPVRRRVLNLSGTNQFVQLPPGVAYARTFAAMIKWNGGAPWQRIFDFGTDTSRYVMLTPRSGNGRLRCDLRADGVTQTLEAPGSLAPGVWSHVALTFDGQRGVLYLNGTAVATNSTMTLSPLNVRAQTNHLGRSKYVADPDFNGQISSFRAHGRVLSAAELTAPQPLVYQPATGATYRPGESIAFSGTASDYRDASLNSTALTWTVQWHWGSAVSNVLGPLTGVTNGTFNVPYTGVTASNGFYRVALTATDSAQRKATQAVDVFPAADGQAGSPWAASYPFTAGAHDASNRWDGLLASGAVIATDATRGRVLRLAGSGQHVVLPSATSAFQTLSAWVKWNGGRPWQRLFDFGRDPTAFVMLTPATSSGSLQCALTSDSADFVQVLETTQALPVGVWTHVAVTLDGRQGVLYLNGQPAAINNSVNLEPADIGATQCYLGRSQLPADPAFSGQIDAVRLSSRPLAVEDITASFIQPSLRVACALTNLTLQWPAWAASLALWSTPTLTPPIAWSQFRGMPFASNGWPTLRFPVADESQFYRLDSP
jgi:arabinan endo-1,5-alpha-L-arabinosidase